MRDGLTVGIDQLAHAAVARSRGRWSGRRPRWRRTRGDGRWGRTSRSPCGHERVEGFGAEGRRATDFAVGNEEPACDERPQRRGRDGQVPRSLLGREPGGGGCPIRRMAEEAFEEQTNLHELVDDGTRRRRFFTLSDDRVGRRVLGVVQGTTRVALLGDAARGPVRGRRRSRTSRRGSSRRRCTLIRPSKQRG